jgi:hypothetical protein
MEFPMSWTSLLSCPTQLPPDLREQLSLLHDVLPIPDGPSPVTRLFAWVTLGVEQGLLTEKEARDIKLAISRAI